jgi:D-ribose pyranase
MKRQGILNVDLAGRCARLGHTDLVCVADCGLPVPAHVPVVDLALVHGFPAFEQVLDALLEELVVEGHVVADEIVGKPAEDLVDRRRERLGPVTKVPHEELKRLVSACAFVVRTGEATPYANVILRCGVPF